MARKSNTEIIPMKDRDEDKGKLAYLLEALEEAAGSGKKRVKWDHEKVEIEREGTKIKLPAEPGPMPIDDAITALQRLKKDEETVADLHEVINGYPQECIVAFVKAMEYLYGWASPVPTPGFFGPQPPQFLSIQTDVDDYVQVPWGSFKIPGVEHPITTHANWDKRSPQLIIVGKARKKERAVLLELAAITRRFLIEGSIYRGKALHIKGEGSKLDFNSPPQFIDVSKVDLDQLIMSRDVQLQIDTSISAVIRHTAKVRDAKIPLKRGVLLEGPYGTGKTLTSRMTAKLCVDNGWTFIAVDRAESLPIALTFAQRYQPAAVFCEDVDRATEERTDAANDLLNTIDGILTKDAEVMVILTTNHVEKINQAMLRPGRLDAVITVSPPDAEAVSRLIKLYARGLLADGETLEEVGAELAGNIPAVIREVVERSKLAMIAQGHAKLTESDLMISAKGMKAHMALLAPKGEKVNAEENLGRAVGRLLEKYAPDDIPVKLQALLNHLDIEADDIPEPKKKAA